MTAKDRPKWLKWLAVAVGALSLIFVARVMSTMSNEVTLTYIVPTTSLEVRLFDGKGTKLRTSHFGRRPHQHTLSLPSGPYAAELVLNDGRRSRHPFVVEGETRLTIESELRR